jgi:hypothetical protein
MAITPSREKKSLSPENCSKEIRPWEIPFNSREVKTLQQG